MKKEKGIGAWELMQKLQSDPEWVARQAQLEQKTQALVDEFRRDASLVLQELAEIGFYVNSPCELLNLTEPYTEALPVLVRHLQSNHPRRIRESIITALAVPFARGEPARAVLEEFRHSGNEHHSVRWSLVDTLELIADVSMVEEMETLAAKERDESVGRMLEMAIRSAKKRSLG